MESTFKKESIAHILQKPKSSYLKFDIKINEIINKIRYKDNHTRSLGYINLYKKYVPVGTTDKCLSCKKPIINKYSQYSSHNDIHKLILFKNKKIFHLNCYKKYYKN